MCRVALAVLAAVFVCPAGAATIRVPDDYPTIQAGIDAAGAGDTVLVACGRYVDREQPTPDGLLSCLILKSGVVLEAETAGCVTIDAGQQGRVIYADGVSSVELHGFRLINGSAAIDTDPPQGGGIALLIASSITLADCLLSGGYALHDGGGLSMVGGDCIFRRCDVGYCSSAVDGGGMALSSLAAADILECTFHDNSADNGSALSGSFSTARVNVENSSFLRNTATAVRLAAYEKIRVTTSVFQENGPAGSFGTAALAVQAALRGSNVEDCLFLSNSARAVGAILVTGTVLPGPTTPSVRRCRFEDNHATGSMSAGKSGAVNGVGYFELVDCVLLRNSAPIGGALVSEAIGGDEAPLISGCTFAFNSASREGVIFQSRTLPQLDHCLVAFNEASDTFFCTAGGVPTLTCSDVFGNSGGDWEGCIAGQGEANANFSADPLFCDGSAGDLSLDSQSPCLPAASPCGELVGGLGPGCAATGANARMVPATWGRLKSLYRK